MSRQFVVAILTAAALLGLASCASPEQLRAEDDAACASYGFPRGTSDFANCMQRESLARRYSPWLGPPPFGFGWYDGHMSPPRAPADIR